MGIAVRAKVIKGEPKTVAGYYDHRRRYEGEEFTLEDQQGHDKNGNEMTIPAAQQFSERWMERCSVSVEPESEPAKLTARERMQAINKARREHTAAMKAPLMP